MAGAVTFQVARRLIFSFILITLSFMALSSGIRLISAMVQTSEQDAACNDSIQSGAEFSSATAYSIPPTPRLQASASGGLDTPDRLHVA